MTENAAPADAPLPFDADGLLDLSEAGYERLAAQPSYLVFAQQPDTRIDFAAWQLHAARFFALDLSLTCPKRYRADPPTRDGALVVLRRTNGDLLGVRSILLQPRADEHLAHAERATGGGGLALLAKRCPTIALVQLSGDLGSMTAPVDGVAALLAAHLSSVLLGPVLSPDRRRIVGARTMREEALRAEG
jgi:hypothetical protein